MKLLQILTTAANAVLPIVLLILLGQFLRRKGFFTKDFLAIGSKLGFEILLPCMLFVNVYNIAGFSAIQWDIVLYSCIMLVVLFCLGIVFAVAATRIPERRGVITQCVFRSNIAIIGLPLASTLGGSEAIAIASIVCSLNGLCIVSPPYLLSFCIRQHQRPTP